MSTVQYACDCGYAIVTLSRPDKLNAFDRQMILDLNETLRRTRSDEDAYVVVLTGAGDGFCSGADITSMPDWTPSSGSR